MGHGNLFLSPCLGDIYIHHCIIKYNHALTDIISCITTITNFTNMRTNAFSEMSLEYLPNRSWRAICSYMTYSDTTYVSNVLLINQISNISTVYKLFFSWYIYCAIVLEVGVPHAYVS